MISSIALATISLFIYNRHLGSNFIKFWILSFLIAYGAKLFTSFLSIVITSLFHSTSGGTLYILTFILWLAIYIYGIKLLVIKFSEEEVEPHSKKNIFNSLLNSEEQEIKFWGTLVLGLFCITLPFALYLIGCYSSDWECSGDDMGGIMMIYALSVFIPSVVGFIYASFYVLTSTIKDHKVMENKKLFSVTCYFLISAVCIYELILHDLNHIDYFVKRAFLDIPYSQLDSSSSLSGSDDNENYIRDDVEKFVDTSSAETYDKLKIEYSKIIYRIFTAKDQLSLSDALHHRIWIWSCIIDWHRTQGHTTNYTNAPIIHEIESMYRNTYQRFIAFNELEKTSSHYLNDDPPQNYCSKFY